MGLFGSLSGIKSNSSSSTTSNSNTYYTPYSDTAVETLKQLEQSGLDLSNLLKGTTGAQQTYQTDAYGAAGENLAGLKNLVSSLYSDTQNTTNPLEAANKAETSVLSEVNQANEALKRDLARYGINPNSMASNLRANNLDAARFIVGARAEAEKAARDENTKKLLNAITAGNTVLGNLTGYDATGAATNAMGVTTGAAQVGLTPKSETTNAKSSTRGKSTTIGGNFGFKGLNPGGFFK